MRLWEFDKIAVVKEEVVVVEEMMVEIEVVGNQVVGLRRGLWRLKRSW